MIIDGRNATFAIGETRFGLRSKHQRLESDHKMKKDVYRCVYGLIKH